MVLLNRTLIIFCLLLAQVGFAQNTHLYTPPQTLNHDGWLTSGLSEQRIDTASIYKMLYSLRAQEHQIHSIILVRNNRLVLEEYFGEGARQNPHDLRSTTKSIRAILMGIAVEKGFIKSIDDSIFDYLKSHAPEKNSIAQKQQISIRHLLTMSSGLDCNDWDKNSLGQEDKVYRKKDIIQYTLDLPLINTPGEKAAYCSMGSILTAEIISQASGMSIDSFAKKYLFDELGIDHYFWGHTSKKQVIPSAKRLYMTSRDMAKIGQLVLNNGQWNGKQLVSKQWLTEATKPNVKITGMDYGYFWWSIPFKVNNQTIHSIMATGNGGQYIMIFPSLELIAVFTGGAYNSEADKAPFALMQNLILPAVRH